MRFFFFVSCAAKVIANLYQYFRSYEMETDYGTTANTKKNEGYQLSTAFKKRDKKQKGREESDKADCL